MNQQDNGRSDSTEATEEHNFDSLTQLHAQKYSRGKQSQSSHNNDVKNTSMLR